MPRAPMKVCAHPGCSRLVQSGVRYCELHALANKRRVEADRATATERGYDHRWRKARSAYLMIYPDCVLCGQPATVVDHRVPHKGNQDFFWDESNWQPLCRACHDSKTAREDGRWG